MRGGGRPSKNRGVALITALLLVSLATVAAVAMVSRQYLDIRRTSNAFEYDQAYLYVLGIEAWVGQILMRDARETGSKDSLDEKWAFQNLPPIPVDGGELKGRMEDMQGRFNINDLLNDDGTVNQNWVKRFEYLLSSLGLNPEIALATVDWMDGDIEPRFPGAEDDAYLGLERPYRTGNRRMAHVSELRLVKGVDGEGYAKLAPYLAALPKATPLNVNTVTKPELLTMLASQITRANAEGIIAQRGEKGFSDINQFTQELQQMGVPQNVIQEITPLVKIGSSYFMVTSEVLIGRTTVTMNSLLERDPQKGTRTLLRYQGI